MDTNPVLDDVAQQTVAPVKISLKQRYSNFRQTKIGKIFPSVLGLLLLVGSLGAGSVLVQQNQNIAKRAGECVCLEGNPNGCTGTCSNGQEACTGTICPLNYVCRDAECIYGDGGGGGHLTCPSGTTNNNSCQDCTCSTCSFYWDEETGVRRCNRPPYDNVPICCTPNQTPTPTATPPTSCNKNLDIVLVIDRSSTMTQTESDGRKKLDWAKDAAKGFLQAIQNTKTTSVKVGVASFGAQGNDGAGTLDPSYNSTLNSPLTNNFTGVIDSISKIVYTKPGTCVECGLRIGNNQLTNTANKRVVVLLSDGMANHSWNGSTNTDDIANAINEANRGRSSGIEYRSVGYGSLTAGQINENTLLQIAGEPNFYQYKPNVADWSSAFIKILADLCNTTPTPPPSTSVILSPIGDTYLNSGTLANTNYGTKPTVALDGSPVMLGLMKFDLTSLANKVVNSALLKIKIADSSVGPFFVKKVTGAWNESTVTYNTKPALGNFTTSFRDGTAGSYVFVNLTQFVNENKGTVASFSIDEANSDGLQFNSRDATTDRPQLIVR